MLGVAEPQAAHPTELDHNGLFHHFCSQNVYSSAEIVDQRPILRQKVAKITIFEIKIEKNMLLMSENTKAYMERSFGKFPCNRPLYSKSKMLKKYLKWAKQAF